MLRRRAILTVAVAAALVVIAGLLCPPGQPVALSPIQSPAGQPAAPLEDTDQAALPQGKAQTPALPAKVTVLTHWLNTASGVRHNPSCRWFHNTVEGRPCGPDEGWPGGCCGG
jgi:hypothetical protein